MEKWTAILSLRRQRELFSPRGRCIFWLAGLLCIALWQAALGTYRTGLDDRHSNLASLGAGWQNQFFMLYHKGYFPLHCHAEHRVPELAEAERLLRDEGTQLVSSNNVDRLPAYLFFVDAWLGGDPRTPVYRTANAVFFILGLMLFFSACVWIRLELLGALCVLFVGSNPYQLFETYAAENVFGWPVTTALLGLAAVVPLLGEKRPHPVYFWLAPVVAGLLVGSARHIRGETLPIAASLLWVCALVPHVRWWTRLALPMVFVLATLLGMDGWKAHFKSKQREAEALVAASGGAIAPSQPTYHPHWIAIWCGLGDFDDTYGYAWDDRVVHEYYLSTYFKEPATFDRIVKRKVVQDITGDPVWFLRILSQRAWRILAENTPVRLAVGPWWLDLPLPGWIFPFSLLGLVGLWVWKRNWELLKFLLLPAPLAATPLLVYSGGGLHYYSIEHLFVAAVLLALAAEAALVYFFQDAPQNSTPLAANQSVPPPTS